MYSLPKPNYLRRNYLVNDHRYAISKGKQTLDHNDRIKYELRQLGMTKYGLRKMESRYLPHIIRPDEHMFGVVYGLCEGSSVLIVATDRRVIFLDRKPLFINEDEITYDIVGGVKFSQAGLGVTVTLHTRVKDYVVKTMNEHSAQRFVNYIESRTFLSNQPPQQSPLYNY
jgi:hypothetical protein